MVEKPLIKKYIIIMLALKLFILTLIWTLVFIILGLVYEYFRYLSKVKED